MRDAVPFKLLTSAELTADETRRNLLREAHLALGRPLPMSLDHRRSGGRCARYGHRSGLVRDIKPQNIVLTPDGGLKVRTSVLPAADL